MSRFVWEKFIDNGVEEDMTGWKCGWDDRQQTEYRTVGANHTGEPRLKKKKKEWLEMFRILKNDKL